MTGRIGGALVGLALASALLAGWLAPADPSLPDLGAVLRPPSAAHWLGTDDLGRDVLGRLLHGGRLTLALALLPALAGAAVGIPLGLLSGMSRRLDPWLMRLCDVALALPAVLLALVVVAVLGPGLPQVGLAVAMVAVPVFMRQARAAALELSARDYIVAARALGIPRRRVLLRHLLPNAMPSLAALLTAQMGVTVLEVSGLSFLGCGGQPGLAEWGTMLAEARAHVYDAPWLMAGPGACLASSVLGFTLLGDAVRARLDAGTAA